MIHCLPGFLGRGADFAPFVEALNATGFGGVLTHDLFNESPGGLNLKEWGRDFSDGVAGQRSAGLVGYSLGGRLALHALIAKPDRWRAAVIVSAHTGLPTEDERQARLVDDRAWADRFARDSWEEVIEAWNGRTVFGGKTPPERAQRDFVREALVAGLTDWSLGAQEDMLPQLGTVQCPVLWVVGESDTRFRRIGELAVDRIPRGRLEVIPKAAHRVLVDAPQTFARALVDFLKERTGV